MRAPQIIINRNDIRRSAIAHTGCQSAEPKHTFGAADVVDYSSALHGTKQQNSKQQRSSTESRKRNEKRTTHIAQR